MNREFNQNHNQETVPANISQTRLAELRTRQEKETKRLSVSGVDEDKFLMMIYSPELLDELEGLAKKKRQFEGLVVDCTLSGYAFPTEIIVEASKFVDSLIELRGALVFLRTDNAFAIVKEYISSAPTFRVFSSYAELFDFSPELARFIKSSMGDDAGFDAQGTDLAQQILLSAIPVLTKQGLVMKGSIEQSSSENLVLAIIDNYCPVATIIQRAKNRLSEDEVLLSLRELEHKGLIFPLFPKIPFLANCFKMQRSISLEEYLTGTRILPQSTVEDLSFELQGHKKKTRTGLGVLAVKKGKLTSRLLEVALKDLAFYTQIDESSSSVGKASATSEEERLQSLVGYLASTDPMSLLQNMATNRESGVLSVENRDQQFKAHFESGRLANARMAKLHGDSAVVEFASSWKHGIFVFIKREPPQDLLVESCKLNKPLDKLLLDAALAQDNTDVIWKRLPNGSETMLEKVEKNRANLYNSNDVEPLIDLKEKQPLTAKQMKLVRILWEKLDGLTTITRVVKEIGTVTTPEVAWATGVMLDHHLVAVPDGDLKTPLDKFQRLIVAIRDHIGSERNSAFVRLSLRDTLGYSGRARVFTLTKRDELGVNMAALRQAGVSLSQVISDLENWQVKYIEYVNQELDRESLLTIIRAVHQ